ncbi:hypothetical protein [Arthrobacter sp. ISL-48]|nr:hypothetical protein [Arthrobacter sp. ISL-48]
MVRREVQYKWWLSELMAARGLHNTTDLIRLLAERGNQKSERVTVPAS